MWPRKDFDHQKTQRCPEAFYMKLPSSRSYPRRHFDPTDRPKVGSRSNPASPFFQIQPAAYHNGSYGGSISRRVDSGAFETETGYAFFPFGAWRGARATYLKMHTPPPSFSFFSHGIRLGYGGKTTTCDGSIFCKQIRRAHRALCVNPVSRFFGPRVDFFSL